jgi:UDP-glucose:(heptosyl)LPS alpha-1,3-glucosyltransferase
VTVGGPMKIAMLVRNFVTTGGAERYAVELSTRLGRRGHDVHVYAYRWDPGVTGGLTMHRVPYIRRPRFVNALLYAFLTRRLVRQEPFDIIHSHQRTIHHHVLSMHHPCYVAGRFFAGPLRQALDWIGGLVTPRHLVYRWLEFRQFHCRSLACVVAVSHGIKRDILAHHALDPETIHVIYPGVDVDGLSPERIQPHRRDVRKRHQLTDDDLAVVFVGSEFKRKGLRYAIEALGLLARERRLPAVPHLFVLGGGDPSDYRRLAERLEIAARVHFIGLYPQVEHYYAAADLCLLPTLSDPGPLVVLEALAAGLPVIVSRQAGTAELLLDGENARLLDDPRDVRRLADAILSLADPAVRRRMGERARKTVSNMTWDAMADEIEALYRRALSARPVS